MCTTQLSTTQFPSGHATEAMQRHYSTVADDEVRAGLAKVIDLAKYRSPTVDPEMGHAVGSVGVAAKGN